jgi:hypothetical protein
MCGAATCRGFIGKRKAILAALKVDTPKKNQKGKVVNVKVKRVVQGRITKISTKKVKAQVKNGKVVKASVVSRKSVKATQRTTKTTVKKTVKNVAVLKKITAQGKRKRSDSPKQTKAGKKSSPAKGKTSRSTTSGRKITKPVSKATSKSTAKMASSAAKLPIFDTVSHRPRKRNVR